MSRKKTVAQIKSECAEALADRYYAEVKRILIERGARPEDVLQWLVRWESQWYDAAYEGVPAEETARKIAEAGYGPWPRKPTRG